MSVRIYQISSFMLGIPPIRHFSNNGGFLQRSTRATSIIDLVEDKVEITAGAVDIVEQKIGGNHMAIAVPLGKQLSKESGRKGIAHTRTKNARIE